MNLKNPFRRNARNNADDKSEPVFDMMRPWWAWGPLGLVLYGSHHSDTPVDPGQISPSRRCGPISTITATCRWWLWRLRRGWWRNLGPTPIQ